MWRLRITSPADGPCSHIGPSRVQGMPYRLRFPSGVLAVLFCLVLRPKKCPDRLSLVSHFCRGLARLVSGRHWLQDGNIGAFVYSFSSLPARPVVGSGCVPVLEATAPPASPALCWVPGTVASPAPWFLEDWAGGFLPLPARAATIPCQCLLTLALLTFSSLTPRSPLD